MVSEVYGTMSYLNLLFIFLMGFSFFKFICLLISPLHINYLLFATSTTSATSSRLPTAGDAR